MHTGSVLTPWYVQQYQDLKRVSVFRYLDGTRQLIPVDPVEWLGGKAPIDQPVRSVQVEGIQSKSYYVVCGFAAIGW